MQPLIRYCKKRSGTVSNAHLCKVQHSFFNQTFVLPPFDNTKNASCKQFTIRPPNEISTNKSRNRKITTQKIRTSDFNKWLNLFEDENTTKMLGMDEFKTANERCEKWFE